MCKFVSACLTYLDRHPWPVVVEQFQNERVRKLAAICWLMQQAKCGPFAIGERAAAAVLGVSQVVAGRYFDRLLESGFLKLESSGHQSLIHEQTVVGLVVKTKLKRMASEYTCPSAERNLDERVQTGLIACWPD